MCFLAIELTVLIWYLSRLMLL